MCALCFNQFNGINKKQPFLITPKPITNLLLLLFQELILHEGTEFFDIWKDVPIPIYQKIYIFNITNPVEFVHEGKKPNLQELGPYVFR